MLVPCCLSYSVFGKPGKKYDDEAVRRCFAGDCRTFGSPFGGWWDQGVRSPSMMTKKHLICVHNPPCHELPY